MKKILLSLTLLASVFVLSCKGPAGPPGLDGTAGPQGPPGASGAPGTPGVNVAGNTFNVNVPIFNAANDFQAYFDFPKTVEVLESDAVLVYREWEQLPDDKGGAPISVWRLLPQTVFLPQGALQYNFDHTFLDATMFVDAQFDRNALEAKWTTNQKFRVVIIPADFPKNGRLGQPIDYNDYKAVSEAMNTDESKIQTYQARK